MRPEIQMIEAFRGKSSTLTGEKFTVGDITDAWDIPRSTLYLRRTRQPNWQPKKRGPKPVISDSDLRKAVEQTLITSPFRSEGHRKIWARMRVRGIRTSKRRVLRALNLLRPRPRYVPIHAHHPRKRTNRIITDAPNIVWGTDMTAIMLASGKFAYVFVAVDHCTGECLGIHASMVYSVEDSLVPIKQAVRVRKENGELREVVLRHDRGKAYQDDGFRTELKSMGLRPFLVRQWCAGDNGCAERFIRTLRENVPEIETATEIGNLADALRDFQKTFNSQWLMERHQYRSPAAVYADYNRKKLPPGTNTILN